MLFSQVFGLPQSFGSIFLGEVFCSYLSVFNESQDSATAVSVTAELQVRVCVCGEKNHAFDCCTVGTWRFVAHHRLARETVPGNYAIFPGRLSIEQTSHSHTRALLGGGSPLRLQTGSDRALVTPVKAEPKDSLEPGGSMDIIVKHEVKELGTHLLVCSVAYLTESGEKKTFRKFFRFQVYKPLDIKTMVSVPTPPPPTSSLLGHCHS